MWLGSLTVLVGVNNDRQPQVLVRDRDRCEVLFLGGCVRVRWEEVRGEGDFFGDGAPGVVVAPLGPFNWLRRCLISFFRAAVNDVTLSFVECFMAFRGCVLNKSCFHFQPLICVPLLFW